MPLHLSLHDILFQHHLYLLHIHLLGWHGGVLGKHLLLDISVLENCWFLLVVEKRSVQLKVDELGSGSGRDIEGWGGWVGGFKVTGGVREGRADVFKEGRLVVLVF